MTKELTELRTVRVHFTREEQEKHSTELAEAVKTKQETEADKKSAMANFKAKIDAQDSRMGMLSRYLTNGYDYRSVACVVKKDFERGVKEFYYEGTLVDSVKMTEEDHQLSLNDHAANFRKNMDEAGFKVEGFDKDTNTLTMRAKE